jgi:hypothetical protein
MIDYFSYDTKFKLACLYREAEATVDVRSLNARDLLRLVLYYR